MPIETITFRKTNYPILQSQGFASQYAFPFAEKICKGVGIDIGYSKPEWKFRPENGKETCVGIDDGKICTPSLHEYKFECNANFFDFPDLDYIFSSHCLEHVSDWVGTLDYWSEKLKSGGVMFLYLPHCDFQEYWQPMFNRKHCNWLRPDMLQSYYEARGFKNIFITGHDLNYSFYAIAEKA